MVCLGNEQRSFVVFEIASKYYISDSFVDHDGYSISCKRFMVFPNDSVVKNPPAIQEMWVQSLGQEDSLEEEMQPTPLSLPVKFHGQRSLVGHSPWSPKRVRHAEQLNNNKEAYSSCIS